MAPDAVTANRLYADLRSEIIAGHYRLGTKLTLLALARDRRVSVIPLRDALHRLVGEGILELHEGGGFRLPVMDVAALVDLYAWHHRLVRLALDDHSVVHDAELELPGLIGAELEISTLRLFGHIADGARNTELRASLRMTSARLGAVRRGEACLDGRLDEFNRLSSLLASADRRRLGAAVSAYHRRRVSMAPRILESARPGRVDSWN